MKRKHVFGAFFSCSFSCNDIGTMRRMRMKSGTANLCANLCADLCANLPCAYHHRAHLPRAHLPRAHLLCAHIPRAVLPRAVLPRADLPRANLLRADRHLCCYFQLDNAAQRRRQPRLCDHSTRRYRVLLMSRRMSRI